MSEQELIQNCQKQHAASQRLLYEKYAPKMMSVCMRYLNDKAEAEDALQEAFIKIFKHIVHFRSEGSFEGWMRRIFVNTALSTLRVKQIKYVDTINSYSINSSVNPSVIEKMSAQEIFELISTLPNGYRIVFNLHGIEGYSHKEIAETLGITESTSRTQYLKARKALQEKFIQKNLIKANHE